MPDFPFEVDPETAPNGLPTPAAFREQLLDVFGSLREASRRLGYRENYFSRLCAKDSGQKIRPVHVYAVRYVQEHQE